MFIRSRIRLSFGLFVFNNVSILVLIFLPYRITAGDGKRLSIGVILRLNWAIWQSIFDCFVFLWSFLYCLGYMLDESIRLWVSRAWCDVREFSLGSKIMEFIWNKSVYSLSGVPCTAKIALKYSMQFALVTVFIILMNGILLYWTATSKNCWQLNSKISTAMFWNGLIACTLMNIVSLEFFLWCSLHISHVLTMFYMSLLIPLQ